MWILLSSSPPTLPQPGLSANPGKEKKSNTNSHHYDHRIRTLSKSGRLEEALALLKSQCSSSSRLDPGSCSLVLHACITRRSLQHGERLHHYLLSANPHLLRHPTIKAKLITMYSVCGQIDAARRVFDNGDGPTEGGPGLAWVSMSIAYSRNGCTRESLLIYTEMLHHSITPNKFAFSSALKSCADLSELYPGRAIHAQIIKSEDKPDLVLNNALLAFYARCGCTDEASRMFEGMPERNVVSWNSFVAGFSRGDRILESLEIFRKMQGERMVGFTWVTLTTVLSVCAHLAALGSGKEIHAQIIRAALKPDILVMNSLMDMYAKCGAMECCRRVFELMLDRDLTSWNTMFTGYAINGRAEDALDMFDRMVDMGIRPDDVTFIALLSGCSHAGFTEEGCKLFDRMEMDFGVSPKIEHYACLVDLLGRAQRMKEALNVVKRMPMKPSSSIWGSLLNSCWLHADVELGKIAAEKLFELEPNNAANYVMLSNMYASLKMWEEAEKVRVAMEERGLMKETGCSWIRVGNKYHNFLAGGSVGFCNSAEYKRVWKELMDGMRANGYAPYTAGVLHNIDEEMKAEWIDRHSERIALVYGLIHSGEGTPIRIMKNLRVCVDCHNAMKIISRVTRRLIVLRDSKRFHHFHNGACSCRDFW